MQHPHIVEENADDNKFQLDMSKASKLEESRGHSEMGASGLQIAAELRKRREP